MNEKLEKAIAIIIALGASSVPAILDGDWTFLVIVAFIVLCMTFMKNNERQ